ncbi:MAG: hypothetical protein N3G74_00375 [Candidatus Micrarchaeota archaeon]|nr:hypothetical protein [Candidatus Micrarchaeota archaeon]
MASKTNWTIVFYIVLISPILFSLSELGGSCQFTRDCKEGYCIEGTCKIPQVLQNYYSAGQCNSSIDCLNGFCYQSECIIPKRDVPIAPLGSGISNSCAGFIENCTGIFCMFCNATWLILLIAAGFAAFITRKRGRITPVLLFGIPVLAGIIFFPFIGSIIAIIELVFLAFVKPAAIKSTFEDISSILRKRGTQEEKKESDQTPKEKPKQPGEGMEQLPFE